MCVMTACENKTSGKHHLFSSLLQKPERDEWGTGLEACQAALDLEKHVNQALLDLHKVADTHNDPQVNSLSDCKHAVFLFCQGKHRAQVENQTNPYCHKYSLHA